MNNLTDKNIVFCEEYVANGYNGTKAYKNAYKSENKNVCSTEASRLLKKPVIQKKIKQIEGDYRILGYKLGIDKNLILTILKSQFFAVKKTKVGEVPDNIAINNAINTWAKLTGEFAAEKQEMVIDDKSGLDKNPAKLTKEDRKRLKEKILKEL